jgi:undecaprenyl-diphosphatase
MEHAMTMPTAARPRAVTDHRTRWLLSAGSVALVVVLAIIANPTALSRAEAIVLGAVEGITEFLPISSTGHLIVAERLLGLGTGSGKVAADTYAVAIQLGAILAVVGIYRAHIASIVRGLVGRDAAGLRLAKLLIVAFLPSAIVGLALDNTIKAHLFGIWPVVVAWAVGGIFLLVWRPPTGQISLGQLTYRHAAIVGAAQILALWPGTSRSLVTIAAALAIGLATSTAVEFSFLLGLMTLSAATSLDLVKHGKEVTDQFGVATPALGAVVACITAALAVTWFVNYLKSRPMTIFGWYRLAAAAVTILLVATNQV